MHTARELVGNVTADLTTAQRVDQEHSTGIKKKHKNLKTKVKNKLKLCQLVNRKSISQIQSSREVNVLNYFCQFNPDLKVWLASKEAEALGILSKQQLSSEKQPLPSFSSQRCHVRRRKLLSWIPSHFSLHTPGIVSDCFASWSLWSWLL